MCSKCNMSFKPVKFTFGDDVMIKLMGMAQANQDNPIVSKQQHYVSLANGWAATIVEKTN